ncbi:hypothetical protein [Haloechinothrix sp. LS1_15]|uniref:hypothetical protein n=1 Tax=Haloechinothrix sp. LS1_15 TaxID=2652248 RepID=UPI00294B58DB|nr:hypothetical protein [Haloechinothrix sp. LS1_15]
MFYMWMLLIFAVPFLAIIPWHRVGVALRMFGWHRADPPPGRHRIRHGRRRRELLL